MYFQYHCTIASFERNQASISLVWVKCTFGESNRPFGTELGVWRREAAVFLELCLLSRLAHLLEVDERLLQGLRHLDSISMRIRYARGDVEVEVVSTEVIEKSVSIGRHGSKTGDRVL